MKFDFFTLVNRFKKLRLDNDYYDCVPERGRNADLLSIKLGYDSQPNTFEATLLISIGQQLLWFRVFSWVVAGESKVFYWTNRSYFTVLYVSILMPRCFLPISTFNSLDLLFVSNTVLLLLRSIDRSIHWSIHNTIIWIHTIEFYYQ